MQDCRFVKSQVLFIAAIALFWLGVVAGPVMAEEEPVPVILSPDVLGTLLEFAPAPMDQHAADPDRAPCNCETILVSGSSNSAINGTYTYEAGFESEYFGSSHKWLGPTFATFPGVVYARWAVIHINLNTWALGVIVAYDGTEHVIFVGDDYDLMYSMSWCPPDTGWTGTSATITRTGCLCGEIGDVNEDYYTDLSDVRRLYVHAMGYRALPDELLDRADIDGDGDVDLDDAELLARILTELIPCAP